MDGDRLVYGAEYGLSRRSAFATVALGTTFALSVQPVSAQTMITTPADGLVAGEVKVKTKDGKEMAAYRAHPASGTGFGTVLVVQEVFGVHAHIADLCRRFAKAGYYAISPELYFRQGDPKTYTDIPRLISELVSKVPESRTVPPLVNTPSRSLTDSGSSTLTRGSSLSFTRMESLPSIQLSTCAVTFTRCGPSMR